MSARCDSSNSCSVKVFGCLGYTEVICSFVLCRVLLDPPDPLVLLDSVVLLVSPDSVESVVSPVCLEVL